MADPYDAFDTDERPRSTYMSRKDWKVALAALAVMAAILWPIYRNMLRQSENVRCVRNLQQISNALGVYMASNNDRFPPVFIEDETKEPMLFDAGKQKAAFTWMSLLRSGVEERADFVCPSASPDENAGNLHPDRKDEAFASSYGLYVPRSGWPQSMIQNPEQTVVIAETSNRGANGSFNPRPFGGADDGMAIGWDDSNIELGKSSRSVTRLAFRDTSDGVFPVAGPARHDHGLNMLFVSGRKGVLKSGDARIERLGDQATGLWADR